jgi:hypothetical protein
LALLQVARALLLLLLLLLLLGRTHLGGPAWLAPWHAS